MTVQQRVQTTRAALAASALIGAAIVFLAIRLLHPVYGAPMGAVVAVGALWWYRGVFSEQRVALWLEEKLAGLRYSLLAVMEFPETRFRPALESRVKSMDTQAVVAKAAAKLIAAPVLLYVVAQFAVLPLMDRANLGAAGAPGSTSARRAGNGGPDAFEAVITPPAYARLAADTVDNPTSIKALVGSDIVVRGAVSAHLAMPKAPTVLRLGSGASERLIALEPRADSAPHVVLSLPARDTVLPLARGVVTLSASARDDIGITSGWFEMIVSSGDGESFKFRNAVIARTTANGRELSISAHLKLDTMDLKPGDIVHLRAVARDANPSTDAEAGSSETRTLRVYRRDQSDSVEIEAMPPPEVGKSELSQRMLIIMTEKLASQIKKLSKSAFTEESRSIGREQARLRKRVGQIIFTRLTGEEDADDAAGALADTLSPMEALLRAADSATGADAGASIDEEGSDAPVVAVNRPLLEAFNAMWDAERQLGIAEPRQALPHMRAALAAIQRARAAERLYLRGKPPKVVLDIARIRLTGKKDGIDPGQRSPRASALAALLRRQSSFSAAVELLSKNEAAAAIDTLTLLRVDALSEQPAFSAALGAAINDLRASRDATASLRTARRALVGAPTAAGSSRWTGFE